MSVLILLEVSLLLSKASEKRIFHNSKVREARGLVSLFRCFLDGGDFDQQTD